MSLRLQWIHGFSSAGIRGNVRYNDLGRIIYPAGGVCVVLSKTGAGGGSGGGGAFGSATGSKNSLAKGSQHFQTCHAEQLQCVAVHPDERIVATGEAGTSPSIYVWESSSKMKVLSKLSGSVLSCKALFSAHISNDKYNSPFTKRTQPTLDRHQPPRLRRRRGTAPCGWSRS